MRTASLSLVSVVRSDDLIHYYSIAPLKFVVRQKNKILQISLFKFIGRYEEIFYKCKTQVVLQKKMQF